MSHEEVRYHDQQEHTSLTVPTAHFCLLPHASSTVDDPALYIDRQDQAAMYLSIEGVFYTPSYGVRRATYLVTDHNVKEPDKSGC